LTDEEVAIVQGTRFANVEGKNSDQKESAK